MMLMRPYRRKAFLTGIRSVLDLQGTANIYPDAEAHASAGKSPAGWTDVSASLNENEQYLVSL